MPSKCERESEWKDGLYHTITVDGLWTQEEYLNISDQVESILVDWSRSVAIDCMSIIIFSISDNIRV